MAHRVGQKLGHYRLVHLLGSGGFAEVYLGEHLYLKRQVAIKLLHATMGERQREDFLQEAQHLVDLSHPHIVRMLDLAFDGDIPFLVMEYAPNGTLRKRHSRRSQLSPQVVVPYVKQVASALQYIHSQKLVHRDIKPENMLLGVNQEILLSDFGIASVAHTTGSLSLQDQDGTPSYMAPEQLQGKPRPASDQYALGVVVYEWLGGTCPFRGTPFEIATQHFMAPPPLLREIIPSLPASIESVVYKALAKHAQDRFPSVKDFADAFESACQDRTPYSISVAEIVSPPVSDRSFPESENSSLPTPVSRHPRGEGRGPDLPPPTAPLPESDPVASPLDAMSVDPPPPIAPSSPVYEIASKSTAPLSVSSDEHAQNPFVLPVSSPPASKLIEAPPQPRISDRLRNKKSLENVSSQREVERFQGEIKLVSRTSNASPSTQVNQRAKASGGTGAAKAARGRVSRSLKPLAPRTISRKRSDQRWSRLWWAAILVIGLLIVASGVIIRIISISPESMSLLSSGNTSSYSSHVIIVPDSKLVENSYEFLAVSGKPDPKARQVNTHQITAQVLTYSKTVPATGHAQTPGARATGLLIFLNGSANAFTIATGTTLPAGSVSVITDAEAVIPAANLGSGSLGSVVVPAHASAIGVAGNIAPMTLNGACCVTGNFIVVKNQNSFAGGIDPKNYQFALESDVDGVVNGVLDGLEKQGEGDVMQQIKASEQLIRQPQCQHAVKTDQPVGDHGLAVSSLTVTLTIACSGQVYDSLSIKALAAQLLQNQATSSGLDNGYSLVGNVQINGNAQSADASGNVPLLINAKGLWVYQFSDQQKQTLLKMIVGRRSSEAKTILLTQKGVKNVTISGSNADTLLPSHPTLIALIIQEIAGPKDNGNILGVGTPTASPTAGPPGNQ